VQAQARARVFDALTALYASTATRPFWTIQLFHTTYNNPFKMALLVDKHRPRTLDALNYHPELSERLRALASPSAFTHRPG